MSTEFVKKLINIDLAQLKSTDDIENAYHSIINEEAETAKQMESLMSQHVHLEAKIISLHKMLPNLQLVGTDAEQLSNMITFTSTLAENISSKVKRLDVTKNHVSECLQRVEDILDLKFCTDGVQSALQNEDYEQAAAHIHRFLSLDQSVLRRSAADSKEGSSLDEAFAQLHEAENKLKMIVMQRFDEAVRDEDIASVERFFKIFPLLNQHSEGLKKFSIYLSSQIADTAQKNLKMAQSIPLGDKRNNIIYADTLTLLFEGIARVIEIHQPLVETYYGPGKLLIVIDLLQKECDRQSKKILDEFKTCRKLEDKVKLVQQVMKNPNKYLERIDPRELDILLGEMTLLNTRTELYIRFIRRRVMGDIETANQEEDKREEAIGQLEKMIKDCELSKSMQELLGQYIMMEEYFLRESVHKAINMDTIEENSLTSSMLDDVYYILKKCVRRSLASSSVDGICAMVNHAGTLLDTVFYEVLDERLQQGPSGMLDLTQAYNMLQTTFQHGIYHASNESTEKSKAIFLSSLNNVEVACEYTITLRKNLEEEIDKNLGQLPPQQQAKLESCLSSLTSVTSNFKKLLDPGLKQLCKTVVEPRIKTWIDTFLATNHEITDDEFCQFESNDGMRPFVQTFLMNLDLLLKSLKASLTPNNCDALIGLLVSDLTMQLEKAIIKCRLNRLGGLQFDKELRSLITYLTSVTTWTIRDKFARLTQIATILNLEMVSELLDFWGPNSGSLTWRLTPTEVRDVLKLRVDFKQEDIKRLKL